jgi:hypothetical protein
LRSPIAEGIEDSIACTNCRCRICIKTVSDDSGKEAFHFTLQSLGSATNCTDPRTVARGAARQRLGNEAAPVAAKE